MWDSCRLKHVSEHDDIHDYAMNGTRPREPQCFSCKKMKLADAIVSSVRRYQVAVSGRRHGNYEVETIPAIVAPKSRLEIHNAVL